ncbi:MAG: hypothetical protein V5B32_09540 [Candidatus Accumulibacter sp. UW26]
METGKRCRKHIAGGVVALGLALLAPVSSAAEDASANRFDGDWHFRVTPYLWMPTIYASTSFIGPRGIVSVDAAMHTAPDDYLSQLSFAFMIAGEARKGDWSLFTDYLYLKFRAQDSSIRRIETPRGVVSPALDLGSTMDLKSDIWSLAGSYTAWRRGASHLDVFAGTRYLSMKGDLDWSASGAVGLRPGRQREISTSVNKWDVIAGLKGEVGLSDDGRWFMPYYVDLGSGADNTTWQAMVALGYRYRWGDVTLALRNLSYDFDSDGDGIDARFTGLALGATFHF